MEVFPDQDSSTEPDISAGLPSHHKLLSIIVEARDWGETILLFGKLVQETAASCRDLGVSILTE